MDKLGGTPAIAVVGAGLIGRKHIELVMQEASLAAIVDPAPQAKSFANDLETKWFADLDDLLRDQRPDGIIIATPNHLHIKHGLKCVEAAVPALIEKPIADRSDAAELLVTQSEKMAVPILVGHHRRHNPLIEAARKTILDGRLGDIISINAQFWLYKPDDYFDAGWRTQTGGGPVFINLIHDIDVLRHLCGEIVSVQAMDSRRARGFEVEDTAAVLVEFACGALGTVTASDTIVAPWSWEFTSKENPAYPHVEAGCYAIGGSRASLSIPNMELWTHPGRRSWWEPIEKSAVPYEGKDPLVLQLRHFVEVIKGMAEPVVSGREGLQTLKVVEAINRAAASGAKQKL